MKLDTTKGMTEAEEVAFILETAEILPAQYQTNVNNFRETINAPLKTILIFFSDLAASNAQSKLASKEEKRPIEPPLSAELLKFPGHLANLLTGRTPDAKPTKRTHKIALYVCAAESQDSCVEKGVLHNVVYPELRALCRGRGYELHIVDLHWKTALEKQQDHEFPELCVGELTRNLFKICN